MRQAEITLFILQILLITSSPFLPTSLLLLLDFLVMRILFAILLLYFISVGPTVGIFGFVTLAVLYMERNRRKIQVSLKKWGELDDYQSKLATVEEAHAPQKTVPVAAFDIPNDHATEYAPQEDEPYDLPLFEPVAPSQNEKVVLSSSYPVSHRSSSSTASMESIYEQLGVGHVRGVETIA